MSGNRRGKLKEHIEGIHRNCEWIREHCGHSITMIDDDTHALTTGFISLADLAATLDKFAADLYTHF